MVEIKLIFEEDDNSPAWYLHGIEELVVLNLPSIHKGKGAYTGHPVYKQKLQQRINVLLSHETMHHVLQKYIGEWANACWDALTLKYWEKGIDIGTNTESKYWRSA